MGRVFRGLGKTVRAIVTLGVLIIVLVIVLAIAGIGSAANTSSNSSKQVGAAGYARVHTGMTRAQVVAMFGKPETTDATSFGGQNDVCIEYGVLATHTYQFCFLDGRLNDKSSF